MMGGRSTPCWLVAMGLLLLLNSGPVQAGPGCGRLQPLMGERDACLLAAPDGRILVSIKPDVPLIPASTLKVLTALTAYHALGTGYRFRTEFYLDSQGNLKIKGYGDPLLISEVLAQIATDVRKRLAPRLTSIGDLVLDTGYFSSPLTIPGVSDSFEPFDAPNGALCANFNTVMFQRMPDGAYVSGEPQTPLLPSVLPRIRAARLGRGRILLSNHNDEAALYMGQLFAYFLDQSGMKTTGTVRLGTVNPVADTLVYSHTSGFSLDDTVSKLMAYSNNFIANQLLITAGAKAYGSPGNLKKGVRTARRFAREILGITGFHLTEGSGISKNNRICARHLYRILQDFLPHHELMRQTDRAFYKTGTLTGISTRVGYFKGPNEELFPFVVLLNSSESSMDRILDVLYGKVRTAAGSPPR